MATIITNVNNYNNYAMDGTGIAAVSKTGITKLGLRSSADIANSTPTGRNYLDNCYAADQVGTTNDPKLVVEAAPAASAQQGDNYVTQTWQ